MRQIERQMLQAVRAKKNFKSGNTEVNVSNIEENGGKCAEVFLHGNKIYEECETSWGYERYFSLAGWNTPTTRSRLRALGVYVSQVSFEPIYEGKMIDSRKWYGVQ